MVDYYAELNIDRSFGVDEINKELSKLENTWKRRELNSPEKATKMLALIIDAREVFKNTATKSRYDRDLAESRQPSKPVDPNQQRKNDIQKWRTDAGTYYDRGEFDLAKIAIDRALALTTDSSDDDIYSLAASVYTKIGEYNAALGFINNAIVTNPQNGLHYLVKAGICGHSASALKFNDRFKSSQYYEEERKALQTGLNVANSTGDMYAKSCLLGALAFSLYFEPNTDRVRAEELAREALSLGENLGNAQKVLDAVDEQRRADEQAAREKKEAEERAIREEQERIEAAENARKANIYNEAMILKLASESSISDKQRAVALLESIIDYNDSRSQIKTIKQSIESQIKFQEAQEAQEAIAKKRRKRTIMIATAIIAIIAIATTVTSIIHTVQRYRCGDDAHWKIKDSVLIISGTGKINDYDRLSAPWWERVTGIKSIIIEEGITEIGDNTFCSLSNVTSVSLPSTLEYIGYEGLSDLYSLKEMELPENLKVIEPYAFAGNYVEEMTIPASVEYVDCAAFKASDIKRINVDENNKFYSSVDGILFNKDRTALIIYPEAYGREYYKIPDSVVTVDIDAFEVRDHNRRVYLTDLELGVNTDFSQIWIDPNISMMHGYNEEEYFEENSIWVSGIENSWSYPGYRSTNSMIANVLAPDESILYCTVDGVLFSKDMSVLYWFPGYKSNKNYVVPEGVVEIAPYAFHDWNTSTIIESINLPSTLKKIGGYALICDDITAIEVPEGVESIGFQAFGGEYSKLQKLSLPSTIKELNDVFVERNGSGLKIYYNGTISDWKNITIYDYNEVMDEDRCSIFQYIPLQCTDGIIDSPY